MQERSTTQSHVSRSPSSSDSRLPLLVCFSHLRWDFVWQRPQHLLSRAAKQYRVLVVEEPIFKPGIAPHMDVSMRPQGVTVAVPMLPEGLEPACTAVGDAIHAANAPMAVAMSIAKAIARSVGALAVGCAFSPARTVLN